MVFLGFSKGSHGFPSEVAAKGIEAAENLKQIVDELDFSVAAEKVKGARFRWEKQRKTIGTW